jgi:hypothetical protein
MSIWFILFWKNSDAFPALCTRKRAFHRKSLEASTRFLCAFHSNYSLSGEAFPIGNLLSRALTAPCGISPSEAVSDKYGLLWPLTRPRNAPEDGRFIGSSTFVHGVTFFEPLARVAGKLTRCPRAFIWALSGMDCRGRYRVPGIPGTGSDSLKSAPEIACSNYVRTISRSRFCGSITCIYPKGLLGSGLPGIAREFANANSPPPLVRAQRIEGMRSSPSAERWGRSDSGVPESLVFYPWIPRVKNAPTF